LVDEMSVIHQVMKNEMLRSNMKSVTNAEVLYH